MAISFDAPATKDFGAGTTWTHTCASSATFLYVAIRSASAVSGVTYNSVSMTQVGTVTSTDLYYLFRLQSPSSGSNTISVTNSGGSVGGASASYIGTRLSGTNDVSTTAGPSSTTPFGVTLTATRGNNWMVLFVADRSGSAPTANTNCTVRATPSAATSMALGDSNAASIPVGSGFSMSMNNGASSTIAIGEQFSQPVPSMFMVF